MKKLFITSAIALGALFYNTANAQIRIHVGFDLFPHREYVQPVAVVNTPPAPPVCDDEADYQPADDYYYLPDVNAYYNVADQCYFYNDGDEWVSAAYLPGEYYNFDWRTARHFEVRAPRPYMHNDVYMSRFHGADFNWARFRGPQGGFDRGRPFDNRGGFDHGYDNRGGYDPRLANRDNRPFDNRGGFDNHKGGFDNRGFDNRGQNQNFDNGNRGNFQNRDNNHPQQQFNPNQGNQNRGGGYGQPANHGFNNRDNGQHFAQNNNGGAYNGHTIATHRMF